MRPKFIYPLDLQLFAEKEADKQQEPNPAPQPQEQSETISELTKKIAELKRDFVPRSELEKANAERRELTKAIIEGNPLPESKREAEAKPNLNDLAKACLEDGLSNYEVAKRQLAYRKALIEEKGIDPFLPNKHDVSDNDISRANAVAETFEECINECEGNSQVFDALLAGKIKNDDSATLAILNKRRNK